MVDRNQAALPLALLGIFVTFISLKSNQRLSHLNKQNGSSETRDETATKSPASSSCWDARREGRLRDEVTWTRIKRLEDNNNSKIPHVCPFDYHWESTDNSTCAPSSFDPLTFLERWQNRTLFFMADSLSRQLAEWIVGALGTANLSAPIESAFRDLEMVHNLHFWCKPYQMDVIICFQFGPGTYTFALPRALNRHTLYPLPGGNDVSNHSKILAGNLDEADVVLWNVGVHTTANASGLRLLHDNVRHIATHYKNGRDGGTLWWKETTAQHFRDGKFLLERHPMYNNNVEGNLVDGACVDWTKSAQYNESSYGIYNDVTGSIIEAAEIPILRTYRSSLPLFDAHPADKLDCSHYCDSPYQNPFHLQASILSDMVQHAVDAGALPPPNNRTFQQRWDALMEHPQTSVLAQQEVCAADKLIWKRVRDGDVPPALRTCLCNSYILDNHRAIIRRPRILPRKYGRSLCS